MKAALRSFVSTLTAAVLLLAVASGECISCRTSVHACSRKGDCCTPDGRCKASNHKSHPDRCLKAHNSEIALIKQAAQVRPVITGWTLDVTKRSDPLFSQIKIPAPLTGNYSPPEPYILNSTFLI